MTHFLLQVPTTFRTFSVSASTNGATPGGKGLSSGAAAGPVVIELPLDKIERPLTRTRANDLQKVKDLMDSIQQIGLQVPIYDSEEICD